MYQLFSISDIHEITCAVNIKKFGETTVIILAQPQGYTGMSVTNACERIATRLIQDFGLNPSRCIWVEHYWYPEEETFDLITFAFDKWQRAVIPAWVSVDRHFVETLLKGKLTPPPRM